MHNLKPISSDSIPAALDRAERYRLLNEPSEAESICLDVLQIDPGNQRALVMLLLAMTDRFDEDLAEAPDDAEKLLERLASDYQKTYYRGVIHERRAKAHLKRAGLASGYLAHDWLLEAMDCYEQAEQIRPTDNDESILRWNACARLIDRRPELKPSPHADVVEQMLE